MKKKNKASSKTMRQPGGAHKKLKRVEAELGRTKRDLDFVTMQLEKSNQELETFASAASHDLQEPLRTIASYLGLLKIRYGNQLDAEANEFFDYALTGSERLSNMIRDLLNYSRVQTRGNMFSPVDLGLLMDEVVSQLAKPLQATGAEVLYQGLPQVNADSLQMSQLFQHLIGNSLKFRSEKPPVIEILAEKQKKDYRISVKDNGIGFDPVHAEMIFKIFKKLHSKDKHPGSGIGLAICKKIIERHSGTMWAESQPGSGAVFYFTLPAV